MSSFWLYVCFVCLVVSFAPPPLANWVFCSLARIEEERSFESHYRTRSNPLSHTPLPLHHPPRLPDRAPIYPRLEHPFFVRRRCRLSPIHPSFHRFNIVTVTSIHRSLVWLARIVLSAYGMMYVLTYIPRYVRSFVKRDLGRQCSAREEEETTIDKT